MVAVFLVIHGFVAVALIGVVLLQRSDTDGFGLGSGSGSNFLSGRQTANLLTRTTAILAAAFMINSLWLGILTSHKTKSSLVDTIEAVSQKKDAATPADAKDVAKKGAKDAGKAAPEVKDATATDVKADAKEKAKDAPAAKDAAKEADKKPDAKAEPKAAKPAAKAKDENADDGESDEGQEPAPSVPQAE